MSREPQVAVGVLTAKEIRFTLTGIYSTPDTPIATGSHRIMISQSGLSFDWEGRAYTELTFTPTSEAGDTFELEGVTIGVKFHWERKENQRFRGSLCIKAHKGELTAINIIDAEEYLKSVISSEMSATSSGALLQAHAVISRSWLLAQIGHTLSVVRCPLSSLSLKTENGKRKTGNEIIRWWDHEDHDIFDVCADDHCQRYQGLGRTNDAAADAVEATRGQVLMTKEGELCDARFSKCCGGVFERFESCWEEQPHPYLIPRRDYTDPTDFPDLTIEENAREFIEGIPEAFCNTRSERILGQVLNNYDREDLDFYRWTEQISTEKVTRLVNARLETDLGTVTDLIPVERGTSGRIVKLRISGTKGEVIVGKELMIRRVLSDSHLKSSAFTVEKAADGFTLHGAGWGHGVGLCQIGAAVMGERGYDYTTILQRYYPGSVLKTIY